MGYSFLCGKLGAGKPLPLDQEAGFRTEDGTTGDVFLWQNTLCATMVWWQGPCVSHIVPPLCNQPPLHLRKPFLKDQIVFMDGKVVSTLFEQVHNSATALEQG